MVHHSRNHHVVDVRCIRLLMQDDVLAPVPFMQAQPDGGTPLHRQRVGEERDAISAVELMARSGGTALRHDILEFGN
jgi:hypothetical protein